MFQLRLVQFLGVIILNLGLFSSLTLAQEDAEPYDPWEGFNRGIFQVNEKLDNTILKPIARGYQKVVPKPVDRAVSNFFSNLGDVGVAANNVLQFKFLDAGSDVGRVVINSTVGVLGFFDVASGWNLPKHNEDLGQTLGSWGVGAGPYLVLPLFGPSTLRDAAGLVGDTYLYPLTYVNPDEVRYALYTLRTVDSRADLLSTTRILDEAALDPYFFLRNAYLQRREFLLHDGNPPLQDEFNDDF